MVLLAYSVVFSLSALLSRVACQGISDAPAPNDFLRRASPAITVIGDYLYIDGGSVSQNLNGVFSGTSARPARQVNNTLSISMRDPWLSQSVQPRIIPKQAPDFLGQSIWTDAKNNAYYIWGGQAPFGNLTQDKNMWQFKADGQGGGQWSVVNPANPDVFVGLTRTNGASWGTCKGKGFHLGGYKGYDTDRSDGVTLGSKLQPVPGMLTYSFDTRVWANVSASGLNSFGTSLFGGGTCAEGFGDQGVFFTLGGEVSSLATWEDNGLGLLDMRNVSFYNPGTNKWYSQATTGDIPDPRSRHCVAGIQGPNKRFDIYVYGGKNARTGEVKNDIYVLSLPGFRWSKVPISQSPPREFHACTVVGNQMIVVGGWGKNESFTEKDEFPQGLGVFNFKSLTWSAGFDTNTGAYDSPQQIKDFYNQGGLDSVAWANTDIKTMFQVQGASAPKSSPVAAIIGGVVGGVALIAIVAALIFLLRRRHRQHKAKSARDSSHEETPFNVFNESANAGQEFNFQSSGKSTAFSPVLSPHSQLTPPYIAPLNLTSYTHQYPQELASEPVTQRLMVPAEPPAELAAGPHEQGSLINRSATTATVYSNALPKSPITPFSNATTATPGTAYSSYGGNPWKPQ